MRRSLGPFTAPESLVHTRSLADFITTTSGFRFSVYTRAFLMSHALPHICSDARFGSLADVDELIRHVRFAPKSGNARRQHQVRQWKAGLEACDWQQLHNIRATCLL